VGLQNGLVKSHIIKTVCTGRKLKLCVFNVSWIWDTKWRCQVSIWILTSEACKRNLKRKHFQSSSFQSWSHGYAWDAPGGRPRVTFPEKANGIYLSIMDAIAHLECPPQGLKHQLNKYLLIEQTNQSINSWAGLKARVVDQILLGRQWEGTGAPNRLFFLISRLSLTIIYIL